jgi:23S rRNA (adenine2030-N6)-methyltransferase
MNYRHIYHAGNFADVFKHWILTLLLQKFLEKDTPFFILDTHAGIGIYNLEHENAKKTQEFCSGITKLLKHKVTADFKKYIEIVNNLNSGGEMQLYPGSPYICNDFLRSGDRLALAELHPEDFASLEQNFADNPQISLLNQDGYAAIKALLPPLQKRGLIFIDPPFEVPNEFDLIVKSLQTGLKRFGHGVFAIWYPIKDRKLVKRFYSQVKALEIEKLLTIEIHANAPTLNQLSSCGMLIINPPWQLDAKLRANLPQLLKYFEFPHGTYVVEN